MGTETLLAALSGGAALALSVATRGVAPDRALALSLLVLALLVAIAAPLAAVQEEPRRRRGALAALGAFAAVLVAAAFLRGGSPSSAALGSLYVVLHGLALGLATNALAPRIGRAAALATGLLASFFLLGSPYFAGDLVGTLPRPGKELSLQALVLLSPSVALPGTFAGIDVLREDVLYRLFRPSQDVGWSYASPAAALLVQAILVLLALGARKVSVSFPRSRAAKAAPVLLLLVLAPRPAHAQVTSGGASPTATPEGDIGPLNIKIRLSYIVPFIEGNFKVTGYTPDNFPSRLDLVHDLGLTLQYAIPAFEVDVGWPGAGRVWLEYWEAVFKGDFLSPDFLGVAFKNLVVPSDDVGIVEYSFRTIALNGRLDIPVLDWLTLEIIATTRYAHWNTTMRVPQIGAKEISNLDAIFPCIGAGFDLFIVDQIYAYGSVEYLDFSIFGGSIVSHYTEIHGGLRLEFIQQAHVGAEFYMLEVGLNDSRHSYRQRILGPRIFVEVQF